MPRLYDGKILVTEKIDGTNGQLVITAAGPKAVEPAANEILVSCKTEAGEDVVYSLCAGSRNRWLSEDNDNFGFFAWVYEHAEELAQLGPGRHAGEWWGEGIQREYNQESRTFSLLNAGRWNDPAGAGIKLGDAIPMVLGLSVVPVLYHGPWFGRPADPVKEALRRLQYSGSELDPSTASEGVVVYHEASDRYFKAPFESGHKGAR